MQQSVEIRNLKNINKLKFKLPPKGVHILTGVNGSGKTTLLICLQRIGNPHAFQTYFKTSKGEQFDDFKKARITYTDSEGKEATYRYSGARWRARPKRNAYTVNNFGYTQAVFLTSNEERFFVQGNELNPSNVRPAQDFFKNSLNHIFQTDKYENLRRIKLDGRGRGEGRYNYGFVLYLGRKNGVKQYSTEKNFSLGEILLLNALYQLEEVNDNSLVLIDEIELALHPKVQIRFLKKLEEIASEKNLTVIISTHSSSLIKAAKNLIYIERDSHIGEVKCIYDCFPAIALQNVAVTEEVQPDFAFFVEDDQAQYVLESLLDYYFANLNQKNRPIIKILPVAGWKDTIQFAANSAGYLLPDNINVRAFLDLDVQEDIDKLRNTPDLNYGEQRELDLYNQNTQIISFLPITPEKGIVDLLRNNPDNHVVPLQNHFNEVFDIEQIMDDEQNRGLNYSQNPRKAAKKRLKYYIERICNATNRDEKQVRIMLAQYFASQYCPKNHGPLQTLFNPIF